MGRRAWVEWQRSKKKMGEAKEGLFGEAGDRQGAVCRELIQSDWGCLPEGGEEEGLKLCVCLCVCVCVFFVCLFFWFFFCMREWLRECPRKLLETSSWGSRQLRIL